MEAQKLFYLEDKLMKLPGLYLMWTILFVANFVSLLVDDTQGVIRNFNIFTNSVSVIYCSIASVNNIYGNQLPSSTLLIAGPVHQYLHWLLFAYFGGTDVLSSSAVGVMNWISLFVVGIFSIDMIIKTWILSINPNYYTNYLKQITEKQNNNSEDTNL